MNKRAAFATALTLTALLALTGCSAAATSEQAPSPATSAPSGMSDSNMADVMFATMMIPHHEQAVEMADMILVKTEIDDRVIGLAKQSKAAQSPEITTMRGWLEVWGEDSGSGMDGMNHGDGMMTGADMDTLESASGTDASRLFLEQMMQHHEGAIVMAQNEIDNGQYADAVTLAQEIVDAQTGEIDLMREILSSL
jgi:uncharacterized protein (DUF305 family)